MKKILIFSNIPVTIKSFSLSFMKFLREKGYDVEAAAASGETAESVRQAGFRYHVIEVPRTIKPISDFKAFKSLLSLLRKRKFDLVHTQTSKAGFIGRLAAHKAHIPVVVHTAHDWPFHSLLSPLPRYFYLSLERIASRWCDAIIVDSKAVRKHGLQFKVALPKKIHQIYIGIDLDHFHPYTPDEKKNLRRDLGISTEKIVIGSIARLVPDKGIEAFIACAQRLKDEDNLLFILVGEGKLKKDFEKEVRRAGLAKRFIFTGYSNDVAPYLNIFDIFCLPTLREGFGVVFAEAQACGVPVVASNIPSLREVVKDGVTGFLVSCGDTTGFTKALKMLFNPELRKQMGFQGRRHVQENFAVEKVNEKTLNLYRQLWRTKNEKSFNKRKLLSGANHHETYF